MNQSTNPAELIDLSNISIDKSLPVEEKLATFVRQINDPYHYKVGGVTITAQFQNDAPTLTDCYRRLRA